MPAHEFVIACAGFVQVPAGVFFRPEFRVVQPPVGADFLHLAARPFPVRRGRCYRVFDSSASEISVLPLRVFQHIVCQGFQAVLVHLQAVSVHAAQAHALAVPAAFYFVAGQLAPQNCVEVWGNGFLPGVWVFLCPLHHGKAFRLRQSPRPAFLFYVAVEVPEICPRLFFCFRAIFWRIGLRCVGVFLGEVGIYQLAEQPPGVLGVLVLLRLRRSAQVGSPRQFLVQRSALLCSVHGVNFYFLVIRGVLTCAAQEAALTLKRFCAHTLPFCISRKVLLSVGG